MEKLSLTYQFGEQMEIEKLILDDIQPLWGGFRFYLKEDGVLEFEIVEMRKQPQLRRYKTTLSVEILKEIDELIVKHDFFNIKIPERPGVPDEAHPDITVVLKSGNKRTIEKWANDKHEDFDAILSWILGIIETTKISTKPYYEGSYEREWNPF